MNIEEAQKTIAELANENRFMKKQLQHRDDILGSIHMMLVCIGGPLNDDARGYTPPQKKIFFRMYELLRSDDGWDYTEEDESFYPEEE